MKPHSFRKLFICLILCGIVAVDSGPSLAEQQADWVARSNENAAVLLEVLAKFNPEGAARLGVEGFDEEIFQLPPDINLQNVRAFEEAIVELESRREVESHPAVRQDLGILIAAAKTNIAGIRIDDQYMLPYFDVTGAIFRATHALLDDQVAAERRPAALVRLRRYAGLEHGYTPITEQAISFIRAGFGKGLLGPTQDQLEKDLANTPRFIAGIEELFQTYEIADYAEPFGVLKDQLAGYERFVREEVAPLAREDFRLPAEMYAHNLKGVGIDMPVDELVSRSTTSFREIQNEMQALAALIAKERHLASNDYRDVIRELKKDQLIGEAILPHYEQRITELESLIKKNDIVTLPERPMQIRLASEAESAAIPAPHMRPPRLIGNTGEMGEFVLPLKIPGDQGKEAVSIDDFTFAAASWTLTVHEGRPGHEMQFASIIERGVSQARIFFAFNSVNVEGWALYSEAEMKPLMPLDGQLISLQHRLLRAARAFLDPGLQLGTITREEAFRILEEDVVISHPMALQEVERYTYRAPGQATSYFCGYSRLMELRAETERLLGNAFDRQLYHDFILAQGLLPPSILRESVLEGFVKPARLRIE